MRSRLWIGAVLAYVIRSERQYQIGIGPYAENQAMELVVEELNARGLGPWGQFLPYPDATRQKCDLWLGQPVEWAIEVKMGRFRGRVLVYGFDDVERPLADAVDALEILLRQRTTVSERHEATFAGLPHPVFSTGRVVAWEVIDSAAA